MLHISERVYEALLTAYPKEFRDAYGAQMTQVFCDLHREALESGGLAASMGLWIRTLLDLANSAVTERRRSKVETVSVRDPVLAAFLSFLWVGLGQLYTGQKAVGFALVVSGAVWLLVFFSGAANVGGSGDVYIFLTVVCLTVQLWSMWDAYRTAKGSGRAAKIG